MSVSFWRKRDDGGEVHLQISVCLRAVSFAAEGVLATRVTLGGKFPIKSYRQSGERGFQVDGEKLHLQHFPVTRYQAFGPASFVDAIAPSRFDDPSCSSAEQAARANDLRRHVSCCRATYRNEAAESNS
jgi:hypothetical protein